MNLTLLFSCLALLRSVSMTESVSPPSASDSIPFDNLLKSQESSSQLDNTTLTQSPWPSGPYEIRFSSDWFLGIIALPYISREGLPPPTVPSIQNLLFEFADDIEAAYPPPALAPPRASKNSYDLGSCTKYTVSLTKFAILSSLAPSEIVAKALSKLAIEVRRHGPPKVLTAVIETSTTGRMIWKRKRWNVLVLEIEPLGSGRSAEDRQITARAHRYRSKSYKNRQ